MALPRSATWQLAVEDGRGRYRYPDGTYEFRFTPSQGDWGDILRDIEAKAEAEAAGFKVGLIFERASLLAGFVEYWLDQSSEPTQAEFNEQVQQISDRNPSFDWMSEAPMLLRAVTVYLRHKWVHGERLVDWYRSYGVA